MRTPKAAVRYLLEAHTPELAGATVLSPCDAARVLELLEHPPEPNDRLRRAAAALRANAEAVDRAGRTAGVRRGRRRRA